MKVLLTGAAGWLSRTLIKELETHGHELRLLDRVSKEDATIFTPGTAECAKLPLETNWPYMIGEIVDLETMKCATEGMDAVIHLAAATTGLPQHGRAIMEANVIGTYVTLDAARLNGIKRVLYASSINAYGTIYWRLSGKPVCYKSMPLTVDFPPEPEVPYSLSKWFNEETGHAFHRAYGITSAAFRFAGVWPENWYDDGIKLGLRPCTGWSDDLYQWAHPHDVCIGLRQALECPTLPGHGVYTLGGADTRCPENTMDLLWKYKPELAKNVTRPLDGLRPLMCIDRARIAFGYNPQYRFTDKVRAD